MDYSNSTNKRRKRRQHPHATRVRNTIGVMIFRVLFAFVLIGGFAAMGAGIGIYLGILRNAPIIDVADIRPGVYNSVIIEERTGRELAWLSGEENREFISINYMPQHLLDAFIAIEDERFLTHNGIDPRGIGRALYNNLFVRDRVEGASTITQQLIKNMLDLMRNDLVSKLQEQYLAVQFERALTEQHGSREIAKEIILEAYLNMINLGHDWHGVQVAAWNYFGKDAADLTISESAVIAAITRWPSRYRPCRFPENNRYRQVLVLRNMLRLELITEREFRIAYNDPVHDRILREQIAQMATIVRSYYEDAIISQVVEDLVYYHNITEAMAFSWVFGGGLRIYTPWDLRIQEIVDDVFTDDSNFPVDVFSIDLEYVVTARNEITGQTSTHRRNGNVRREDEVEDWVDAVHRELLTPNDVIVNYRLIEMPQPQAAFVIMDHHNGHVLAINGGRGEKQGGRHFCRATVATRSPGSQFKVLAAFVPGVDMGIHTAATHILDHEWTFDDGHSQPWTPRNWWRTGHEGLTSVRRAIYRSGNIVSSIAFQEVGPERAFDYLTNMGFTTLEGTLANGRTFRDTGASVPLGGLTLGVTQLELAAAYASIANLGEYNRPVFYTRVLGPDGRVLLENTPNPRRVMRAPAAYVLTNMMLDTVRGVSGATGGNARFRNMTMPIAGKTGTSQNVADLGFTGYTPYFTASVWLGFDRPRELRGIADGAHLNVWREIMERVHTELELEHRTFQRPDGVITASICRVSGHLPTDMCRRGGSVVSDLFVVGTVPTRHCEHHQETWLCYLSGLPATDLCPAGLWVRGVPPFPLPEYIECPYHGPHTIGQPEGGFWGFPQMPGLNPGEGGFWGLPPGGPGVPDGGLWPAPTPTPFPDVPWWESTPEAEPEYVPDLPDLPAQDQPPLWPDPPVTEPELPIDWPPVDEGEDTSSAPGWF